MINFNGSLFEEDEKIFNGLNRSFRYGDGLFESIRVIEGKMPFFGYHFDRILRGMKALKMNTPGYFNVHYLRNEISKAIEKQSFCRVRLSVWREEGGFYTPTTNDIDFLIETSPLPDRHYQLNDLGLTIDVFKDHKLQLTSFSNYKTCNGLPYVLAGIFAKENSLEDVLMLNTEGYVAEGISSNIFVFKNNQLITPSLSIGCVGGVMRLVVIELAREEGIEVKESNLTVDNIREADEVFYTNAMQGIRWVENFENVRFTNDLALRLHEKLRLRTA